MLQWQGLARARPTLRWPCGGHAPLSCACGSAHGERRVKLKREFARKRVLTEATWFQQNASFAACEALHSDSELYAKRGTRFYEQLPTRRMSNGEQWP